MLLHPTIFIINNTMKQMLSVAGMRCSNCEVLVKEALEELAGVSSAQASQREGSVTVEYDEQQVLLDTLKIRYHNKDLRYRACRNRFGLLIATRCCTACFEEK